jgi:hypothetical protein
MNNSSHLLPVDGAGVSDRIDSRRQAAENTTFVICYDNHIPDFVEAALERLYGDLFSSLPQLRIYGKLTQQTSTYVARKGDEIVTIFLFEHRNRQVRVINEGMKFSADELRLFSDTIFSRYKSADFIYFNGVEAPVGRIPFPHQRLACPGDLVLALPPTSDEYFASLGKHLRYNVRRSLTRLPAEHPSFRVDFYDAADTRENHIREIIGLNKIRMGSVKRVYKRDQEEVQRVIDLCRSHGLVAVMSIDGKVCAGSIGFLVGDTHIGRIVSHDHNYDKYSIGTLCIFLCIRECIARGYKRFNFMSGNNDYKSLFGGKPRHLEEILIYRSWAQLVLNPDVAAKMLSGKLLHHARLRVQLKLANLKKLKSQNKLNTGSRLLFFVLDNLRTLKDRMSGSIKRS